MLLTRICRVCVSLCVVGASVSALLAGEPAAGGFGIGPGMAMVENIKPGAAEVNVADANGFSFEVENGTAEKHVFTVSVRTAKSTISSWETGYENIPDTSALRLDTKEIEVDAKSKGNVKLFIKVPDKPENYNRKWMACVVVSPGASTTTGSSVGLMVASRVQIETTPKDDVDGAGAGDVALIPSSWMMSDARPGDSWAKKFKIRNNTKEEHTYTVKHLSDVEKDEARHARYFGKGFEKIDKESWVTSSDASFTLKPGEIKELRLMVKVAANAAPGKMYEELVFLQDEKGHNEFLRLRTELAPPATAGKP